MTIGTFTEAAVAVTIDSTSAAVSTLADGSLVGLEEDGSELTFAEFVVTPHPTVAMTASNATADRQLLRPSLRRSFLRGFIEVFIPPKAQVVATPKYPLNQMT
jgi:hypothetical protein